MNLEAITAWAWENKEIIGLFAVIATAVGALYQPTRDLLRVLPKTIWTTIRCVVLIVWIIIWPARKLIAWLYVKFVAKHVEEFFDKIFDWFEKRETAKNKLHDDNGPIKATEL